MTMHRENGVFNFQLRIPVKKESGSSNRYAALAKLDNDRDDGLRIFIGRDGGEIHRRTRKTE